MERKFKCFRRFLLTEAALEGGQDLRGRRGLAGGCRRGRRPVRAAVESTGAEWVRRICRALPARRRAPARGDDRRCRLEARPFAARGEAARRRPRPRCSLHRRHDHDRGGALVPARLRRGPPGSILEQVAELVDGAAEVCREAGCALIGGETAELPGVYREEELDFAGTCVGIVESRAAGQRVALRGGRPRRRASSSGLHTDGFSLVRADRRRRRLRPRPAACAAPALPGRGA